MIIGITGHKQAGKDSIAKVLVEQHGFTRLALADKVKEMALVIDPIVGIGGNTPPRLSEVVNLSGWENAKKITEVRRLLQEIGTSCRNIFGKDIWIELVVKQMQKGVSYVISDIRFLNEATWIQEHGELIRVIRPGYNGDSHVSETEMDNLKPDCVVFNYGSLKDLENNVNDLMEEVNASK